MVGDGWTYERAKQFAEKYGLQLKPTYQETNEVEEGIVIAQDPKPEEEMYENDILKVVVSRRIQTPTPTFPAEDNSDETLGD